MAQCISRVETVPLSRQEESSKEKSSESEQGDGSRERPPPKPLEFRLDYLDSQLPCYEDAFDLNFGASMAPSLPELRGPSEAQGVVRPLFGNRPPPFSLLHGDGQCLTFNTPFSSEIL